MTLPSTVCHDKNTRGQHETTYATPLDLFGKLKLALTDITYPHAWINLNKEYHLAVLTIFRDDEEEQKHSIGDAKTSGLICGLDDVKSFTLQINYIEPIKVQKFYVKIIITIVQVQYDIQLLSSLIEIKIRNVGFGLT